MPDSARSRECAAVYNGEGGAGKYLLRHRLFQQLKGATKAVALQLGRAGRS